MEFEEKEIYKHNETHIENDAYNLATMLGHIKDIIVDIELLKIKTISDLEKIRDKQKTHYNSIVKNIKVLYEFIDPNSNRGSPFKVIKNIKFSSKKEFNERNIVTHELEINQKEIKTSKHIETLWTIIESLTKNNDELYKIINKDGVITVEFDFRYNQNLNNNFVDVKYILGYFLTKLNDSKQNQYRIDIISKAYIKLNKDQSKKIIENYHKSENVKHNQIQDLILALSHNNAEEIDIRNCLKFKYNDDYNDKIITNYIDNLMVSKKIEYVNNKFYPIDKKLCEASFIENEDIIIEFYFGDKYVIE
jgi:hypothetical protein